MKYQVRNLSQAVSVTATGLYPEQMSEGLKGACAEGWGRAIPTAHEDARQGGPT